MAVASSDPMIEAGRQMLERAEVAARSFATYDRPAVMRIVRAVAGAAERNAQRLAHEAIRETGFGNEPDKVEKNLAVARGFVEEYGAIDYCGHRVDGESRVLSVPKPAGVVLGVTPSTSPVAAIYLKVLCALLTRNAIVISPHPSAVQTGIETARVLAEAAEAAGAPEGAVQIVPKPTIPLVESMMADPRTRLVIATGGGAVVKAAYRSGTPAIGVGPGNPPVVVDETADLANAAKSIVNSKSFDNSVLCTAESVLFAVRSIESGLRRQLESNGAYICSDRETQRVRDYVYPRGKFDSGVVGRSAVDIARGAGVRVPSDTRVLVAPFEQVVNDEPLTHEKLCPVLGMRVVSDFDEALREAKALVEIVGIGHSAAIHSDDPQRVLDFGTALPVHRVSVNVPASLGGAGIGTGLPMTMSVGTGFVGGSSSGENLNPDHFVQWSRSAYSVDPAVRVPDFSGLQSRGRVSEPPSTLVSESDIGPHIREDLRRIVLEELQHLIGAH